MGWAVFEEPSAHFDYDFSSKLLVVLLFIGGILGCIMASAFVGRVTKNIAHVSITIKIRNYIFEVL